MPSSSLVWLRRDLRLTDHAALSHATRNHESVACVFVFDSQILSGLDHDDRRLTFIWESLQEIDEELRAKGSALIVLQGDPREKIPALAEKLGVDAVYTNHDYEPYAKDRDRRVSEKLHDQGVQFETFCDQVIFEGREVLNGSGKSFKVFTPYKNAWLKKLADQSVRLDEMKVRTDRWTQAKENKPMNGFTLEKVGFKPAKLWLKPGEAAAKKRLKDFSANIADYKKNRDFPSIDEGTSGLSVHLRFGTISIRQCFRAALEGNGLEKLLKSEGHATWISELIWREFYQMILDQNPRVAEGKCFQLDCEKIKWPGKDEYFQAWCEARTGFPIVDAAMRQFHETGWMHNRLRMVVASFLTKDLLVDWRKGEAYFARHLLDYDLASNSGGWQWSASVGCDAQPYFRVFNPESQSEKFDREGIFIRRYLPELRKLHDKDIHNPAPMWRSQTGYPAPIVDHAVQRLKAIELFK